MHKGSYTIEATILMPIMLGLVTFVICTAIDFVQESTGREGYPKMQVMDPVQEFYTYQILGEIGEEIFDD
jgi:hypothetical protein